MTTDLWQSILVGGVGIATIIALIFFVIKSESRKKTDRSSYRKDVGPLFLMFLALDAVFGIGLLLIIESAISLGLIIGLLIFSLGAIMQYYKPLGLTKKGLKQVPNWVASSIIGILMILVGTLTLLVFPMQPDNILRLIPLALIGLGLLTTFISIVTFRARGESRNSHTRGGT